MAALALAGCQPGGTAGSSAPTPPLAGSEIEVTALTPPPDPATADAPPADAAETETATPATDAAAEETLAEAPAPPEAPPEAPSEGASEDATASDPEAPAAPAPPARSAAQQRCERQGGAWAASSNSTLKTCVKPTGEGGKQCRKSTDCKGECLARSGTCAPITPLLGCNDILLSDGTRTTQCLE